MTSATRTLTHGSSADQLVEMTRLSESSNKKCLKMYSRAVVEIFGEEGLGLPTPEECQRLDKDVQGPRISGLHWMRRLCLLGLGLLPQILGRAVPWKV
jgi:hypothetical protein